MANTLLKFHLLKILKELLTDVSKIICVVCKKRRKFSLALCPPSKNGHKNASKNEMNRSILLIYESRPHLFHGLLDNEPLSA